MPVLHATWGLDRRLHLWGEDSDAYERLEAGSQGAGPSPFPAVHPFAVSRDVLAGAPEAAAVLSASATPPVTLDRLVVLLPSRPDAPLPSPGLPVTPRTGAGEPVLRPWRVPSLSLDGRQVLRLFEATSQPGAMADASIRFYERLARIALEIVARGRVLPGVREPSRGRFVARWEPAPGAADGARLRALSRVMPVVCRAAAADGGPRPANDVVAEALGVLVDATVRLASEEARGHEERRGPETPAPRGAARRPADLPARGGPPADAAASDEGTRAPFARALLAPDPLFEGVSAARSRELGRALAAWRARTLPSEGPLRTVFRLVEPALLAEPEPLAEPEDGADIGVVVRHDADVVARPDAPPGAWRIEILVGPRDEPSLLVRASEVWARPRLLAPSVGDLDADEAVLIDLARAGRIYPPLEAALAAAGPAAVELDGAGAHAFLREGAPLLAEAGFGVLLPAWWRTRRRRLGLRIRTRSSSTPRTAIGPGLGARAIVEYEVSVALGDDALSVQELRALARLRTPLVRVHGEWVEVPPDEIAAALRALGGARDRVRTAGVAEFLRGTAAAPAELPVVSLELDGWVERLLSGEAGGRAAALPTPAGFHGELRAYQQRGLGWLTFLDRLGLGACLADDMGLGKTAQLLALLVAERGGADVGGPAEGRAAEGRAAEGRAAEGRADDGRASHASRALRPGPTLVVCPMSVVGNWQREAQRFAPGLRVEVHHGTDRVTGDQFGAMTSGADLVITTYATAVRDASDLAMIDWGRVVLDEAQAIKNSDTRQARAVRRLRAQSRVALTGTPVENRLSELWSILDFLNPGLLGPEAAFRERFAVPIEQDGDEETAERLRRLTGPFILRRVKQDPAIGLELPEKLEMTVSCNLTREQASLYQAVVDDMLERIDRTEGIRRRGLVLETIGRLKQVCNHPAQALGDGSPLAGRSGKLAQLEDVLEEALQAGDRILVFTQYTAFAELLRPYLRERFGREVLYLHGALTRAGRDGLVARFQAGAAPIFILSLRAGGSGINLTAANQVVHFDRWWNPAVEDQASDRAYRIGQTRAVQVRKLVCTGTIEERIAAMSEAKRELAARIVGTGEGWLGDLSTTELRELLALSADAVSER